ncbi:MAG: hypothetical protein Greene07144_461, partial [Parcubacteria group bacterium Greene0714_4]
VKYGETIDFAFATMLFASFVPVFFEKATGGFHRAHINDIHLSRPIIPEEYSRFGKSLTS